MIKSCKKKIIFSIFALLILTSLNASAYNINLNIGIKNNSIDIIIPDDYSSIKSGVENASDGDIIFVRSSIYEENNIFIEKRISLIGGSLTIIKGDGVDSTLTIYADDVNISGFTITGGKNIAIFGNNCSISKNNIKGDNKTGIYVYNSSGNRIENNNISECSKGIYIEESKNNFIKNNQIFANDQGIFLSYSEDNLIMQNDFISNNEHAKFSTWVSPKGILWNKFYKNYWDNSIGILPKWIPGILYIPTNKFISFLPWVAFDLNPVRQPSEV